MREKVNKMYEMVEAFEPYDWLQVFIVIFTVLMIHPLMYLIGYLFEILMKKVFKMQRCTFIKGWKKIK